MSTSFNSIKFDLKDKNTIKFVLSPTRVTYANTLRRAIQTEVQTLGFRADMTEKGTTTDVTIYKNTTPMSNEMLADRIGLLPIAMPPRIGGWEKEKVRFTLHVKNETDSIRLVTASDFLCEESRADSVDRVQIPNTEFFHPNPFTQETCVIAVLKPQLPGQEPEEIHLEAYASLGKGREHARFNPTCQCSYGYSLDSDPGRVKDLYRRWLLQQKKVDEKELESDAERAKALEREFRSLEIQRCYLIGDDNEPYSYDFTIESIGTMPVTKIVYDGLIAASKMAEKYEAIDRGDLPETMKIMPADADFKGFDFWFKGEDHTLGNMLQTWIDDNYIEKEAGVYFVGTKVPHPLRDEMVVRIGVTDGKVETARKVIADSAKGLSAMFGGLVSKWILAIESEGIAAPDVYAAEEAAAADTKEQRVWYAHEKAKAPAARVALPQGTARLAPRSMAAAAGGGN